MLNLTGKIALVTGGGRRLGRVIAEALGADGARVAIHYHRSAEGANEVADLLGRLGGDRATTFEADLADARAAAALPQRVVDEMGGLDIVVNSAAVMLRQPFGRVTPEDWDRVMDVNLRAYFFVAQGAAPSLRARGGTVINISDASSIDPWPSYLPHSVSKAGVQMLTRSLALVMAPEIRVNGILPGAVLPPESLGVDAERRIGERTPLQRLGSPADVVAAVRFLLETEYATGSTVVVDGGATVRPRVWDTA